MKNINFGTMSVKTGYVIFARHWNSKNPITKSDTLDCIVTKERVISNDTPGYIVDIGILGFNVYRNLFDTKKEAKAHLSFIKSKKFMGAGSLRFYNMVDEWQPDRFEFEIVKIDVECNVLSHVINSALKTIVDKMQMHYRGTVSLKKHIPRSDRHPGDFWYVWEDNKVYHVNQSGKLTCVGGPKLGFIDEK